MQKIILFFIALPLSCYAFDHSYKDYDAFLKKNVIFKNKQSYVNYKNVKNKTDQLDRFLKTVSNITETEYKKWNDNQRLSFLINSYNAFTIKLIVDNYPVKSIKDIGSFFSSPWKKKFFKFLGKDQHLDGIEHSMIRKEFDEPRIHFAVVCASIGCPTLQNFAFSAQDLETQLDKSALNFLTDTNKNRIEKENNKVFLSKIFDWYGDDFNNKYKSYIHYISKVLKTPIKDPDISFLKYDWSLNELK